MSGIRGLVIFGLGLLSGVIMSVTLIPDASLSDVFGIDFDYLNLGGTFSSMRSAFRGIMIAFLWGAFGLTIAFIAKIVFGGFGSLFRSIENKDKKQGE